jgi:hypothetical protein
MIGTLHDSVYELTIAEEKKKKKKKKKRRKKKKNLRHLQISYILPHIFCGSKKH